MKARKMQALERRLIESLQSRFGDPESEAPTTLRDQPNEIVYTALQPRKPQEDRSGMMGMGHMPQGGVSEDELYDLMQPPKTAGQLTVESMLPPEQPQRAPQEAQAAPQQAQAAPGPQGPMQAPQQAQSAPMSEEEQLQQLLVTG